MPRLVIRTYRPADEEGVLTLWRLAGLDRPWLNLRGEIEQKRRRDRRLFLVAEIAGLLVAAVMGAYDGRRGWVYHLAVDPGVRRQGIGRAVITELERRMAVMGVEKVNLQVRDDNQDACGFYERLGYVDDRVRSFGKRLA
ncbi:MAG: GNAT family acetyltransferase [Chloroflexi bacterium]|nr:GNAT family acetyltransferase [Chloroflexota bacterium]